MDRYDVIIVGGGPAGSTCARDLVASGRSVAILDKRPFPRDKICAGWITPAVVAETAFDLDDYARGRTLQPITSFLTGLIDGPEIQTDYGEPVSYGIRRCEFDHYLLQRSGATLHLDQPVKNIRRAGTDWVLNEGFSAPLLIGAGGHFCPVSRMLGGRSVEGAAVIAAQEIEFEVPPADRARVTVRHDRPELFFCRDLLGYGWCFRKGDVLNIGLGRLDNRELARHVREFAEFLTRSGKVGLPLPERFPGHAYQLYERISPRLYDEGVLLIGDAAGLAYAESGEGIRPAIESGLLAAKVLADCGSDLSASRLAAYARAIEHRFGKPPTKPLNGWIPAGVLASLARNLLKSRWFTRRVLLDQWFLHRAQTPLVPAAGRVRSAPVSI